MNGEENEMDDIDRDRDPTTNPPPIRDDLEDLLEHRPRAKRSPVTMVLAAVVLLAVGGVAGLLIGRATSNSTQGSFSPFGNGGFGNAPSGGFPNGGNANGTPNGGNLTFGTIESVSGDSITLRTTNGDTVTVKIGDNTQIQVTKEGSVSDLGSGDSVVVAGTRKGGTVAATSISEGGFAGALPSPSG